MNKVKKLVLFSLPFFLISCQGTSKESNSSSLETSNEVSTSKETNSNNTSSLDQISISLPNIPSLTESSSSSSKTTSSSNDEVENNDINKLINRLKNNTLEKELEIQKANVLIKDSINQYYETTEELDIEFSKTGVFKQGNITTSSYSSDSIEMFSGIKNNQFIQAQVLKNSNNEIDINQDNFAKKYNIVNNVTDSNKEITLLEAESNYKYLNLNSSLLNYINTKFTNKLLDEFKVEENTYNFKGHEIINTFYHVYTLSINITNDDFINSYHYEDISYVKATMCNDDDTLKNDATPKGKILESYILTRGNRNDSLNVNPDRYFTESFDVSAYYYDKSIRRNLSKDNPYFALGAKFSMYQLEMDNRLPETAVDDKEIYFVSSSNENVISYSNNELSALKEGNSLLTFQNVYGIISSLEVEVKKLAPKTINIISNNIVKINEKIEIDVEVDPDTSSKEVNYTLSNDNAEIIYENNKTYLKGLKKGNVVLKAISKLDEQIYQTKTITVNDPNSESNNLVGTWINTYTSSSTIKFKAIFNEDGTFELFDYYRGDSAKVGCRGNYEITKTLDKDYVIDGNNCEKELNDYVVIKCSNVVVTQNDDSEYIIDIHFIYNETTGALGFHCLNYGVSNKPYLLEIFLTKEN